MNGLYEGVDCQRFTAIFDLDLLITEAIKEILEGVVFSLSQPH